MRNFLTKLKGRRAARPAHRDWTSNLTPRDWADLPTFHPRREDEAL